MVFSSTVFLFLFFPILILLYFNPIVKSRRFRNTILLFASLAFYAWGEPINIFLMLVCIVFAWYLGLLLQNVQNQKHKKAILSFGITVYVIIFFIFKYLTFVAEQLGLLLNKEIMAINIALPIGISFFLFQLMSYLFDIYYEKAKVQRNLFDVALYISLFPQLIAGPIVRYETIADQINNREENRELFSEGMTRFIYGLSKKVLLANSLAYIADSIFDIPQMQVSVVTSWIGIIAYTLEIYFDFSGYSDMAIGLGKVFGFRFNENFNYPYIAKSITDFWRRWHISLSSWFRDYVYIPLGGNKVSERRWVINLFIVWMLTGIWHGANWTFLFWGIFYFIMLLIEKKTNLAEKLGVFRRIYTLLVVMIAWVFFRANSLSDAINYIGKMFGIGVTSFVDYYGIYFINNGWKVILISMILATPIYPKIAEKLKSTSYGESIESVWVMVLFLLSLLICISSTYDPFIYFNF